MRWRTVAVLVAIFCVFSLGSAQQCGPEFPDFAASPKHSPALRRQLLVPHYTFPCNHTTITQWEARLHWHGRRQLLTRVDFQVWRLERLQMRYQLVGNNSFTVLNEEHQRIGDRLVIRVTNPELFIPVAAGDIVGVYLEGEGVEFAYESSKSIRTYLANLNGPLLEAFSADMDLFRRPFKGAPLVRAQIHIVKPSPTPDTTLTPSDSTSVSEEDHTSPIMYHWTESYPNNQDLKKLIGGIIGGGILVMLMACILVIALLVQRKKRCDVIAGSSSQASSGFLKSSGSEGTLPSHPHLDTKRQVFAFKGKETAHSATHPKTMREDLTKMKNQKQPPSRSELTEHNCIQMDTNLSYSALTSTENDVTVAEHVYDMPLNEATVQPFEYEMPMETSVQLENDYEMIPDPPDLDEDNIYEDIVVQN